MEVVVYKENGKVNVLTISLEALENNTIKEIADKDVPAGLAYKIIDSSLLPDMYYREAWEVIESELTSGVGSK